MIFQCKTPDSERWKWRITCQLRNPASTATLLTHDTHSCQSPRSLLCVTNTAWITAAKPHHPALSHSVAAAYLVTSFHRPHPWIVRRCIPTQPGVWRYVDAGVWRQGGGEAAVWWNVYFTVFATHTFENASRKSRDKMIKLLKLLSQDAVHLNNLTATQLNKPLLPRDAIHPRY